MSSASISSPDQATTSRKQVRLSIVVRIVGGGEFLTRCLDSLAAQVQLAPIEVLVPYDNQVSGIPDLAVHYSQIDFVDTGELHRSDYPSFKDLHELYDRRTAIGLARARGEILAIVEDYGVPDPDWCNRVMNAHRVISHGVIGGAVEHNGHGLLNWAVYFLDFGRYQLPLREAPSKYVSDVNVSYKRSALESVRELWTMRYNEAIVHHGLSAKGTVLWLRPQVIVREDRGKLTLGRAVQERFHWGRVFGRVRSRFVTRIVRVLYVVATPVIPCIVTGRIIRKVLSGGRNRRWLALSLPLVFVLSICWCIGESTAYLTSKSSERRSPYPYSVLRSN